MGNWYKFFVLAVGGINVIEVMTANEKILQQMPEDDAKPLVVNVRDYSTDTAAYHISVSGALTTTAQASF